MAQVADDEPGFAATLQWSRDGVEQQDIPMADDGLTGDMDPGDTVFGGSLGVLPEGTNVSFKVRTEDADGNVLETFDRSFEVVPQWLAQERLLLVVDSSFSFEGDEAERYYRETLDTLGTGYDFWHTDLRGTPDPDDLAPYQDGAVIWAALDSSTFLWYDLNVDRSTSALASYLDGGGRLFLSAQRADSLEREAPGFYSQYLHSSDAQACVGVRDVQGTAGDLIGDGLTFRIQGGDGASNQFCPHVITPIAPAETVFSYVDLPVAGGAAQTLEPQPVHDALSGMSHQELPWLGDATSGAGGSLQPLSHLNSGPAALRVDTGEYGLVYFAFGFEAIDSLAMRQEVMLRVLGCLGTLGSFVQGEVEFQGNMEGFGARVLLACGAVEIAGATEPDGTFSVRNVPKGTCNIEVRAPGHIPASKANVTVVAGETTQLSPVRLLVGDLDGDGVNGARDLALLASNLGRPESPWPEQPPLGP